MVDVVEGCDASNTISEIEVGNANLGGSLESDCVVLNTPDPASISFEVSGSESFIAVLVVCCPSTYEILVSGSFDDCWRTGVVIPVLTTLVGHSLEVVKPLVSQSSNESALVAFIKLGVAV